jgi:hypothetical protein
VETVDTITREDQEAETEDTQTGAMIETGQDVARISSKSDITMA